MGRRRGQRGVVVRRGRERVIRWRKGVVVVLGWLCRLGLLVRRQEGNNRWFWARSWCWRVGTFTIRAVLRRFRRSREARGAVLDMGRRPSIGARLMGRPYVGIYTLVIILGWRMYHHVLLIVGDLVMVVMMVVDIDAPLNSRGLSAGAWATARQLLLRRAKHRPVPRFGLLFFADA